MALNLPRDRLGAPIDALRPGTAQTVSFTATSAASTVLGSKMVRVVATTNCWITLGTSPTAVADTGMLLVAGWPERIVVNAGEKIAVLRQTADGVLNITELA